MRFRDWINETTTTSSAGGTGADSVTSNKLLRVRVSDDTISNVVSRLDKYKKNKKKDIVTLDLPSNIDKKTMKILSKYTV